jgi:hypothetical protein
MNKITGCFLLLAGLSSVAGGAWASSPTSSVGSSTVNAGEATAEFRFGYSQDEAARPEQNRYRARQQLDYGFTDSYAFRVIFLQDKRDHDNWEHNYVTLENRFQLIERETHGWDGGFRFSYTQSDGDKSPNGVEFRLVSQVPFWQVWEWRQNTIFGHEVGPDATDGINFELRNQITRRFEAKGTGLGPIRVGLEMFNDFGNLRQLQGYDAQDHQFGPVLAGNLSHGFFYQIGYRYGISESGTAHTTKFYLGRKF